MIKAILTDIEGTTSSIHFVKQVLFPYAAKHLGDFVRNQLEDDLVQAQLQNLWEEYPELKDNLEGSIEQLLTWIEEDRKHTVLKTLQGMIWKHGYENGDYQAHIYPDALEGLRRWDDEGLPLFVFSSGSIAAQKLFFKYSEAGDLSSIFKGNFDTTYGAKSETSAYTKIQDEIGLDADQILFLSDVVSELDAAATIGMKTTLLIRPEDSQLSEEDDHGHPCTNTFANINLT